MMCVIFVELPSTGHHLVSYRIVSADCSSLPAQSAYVTKNFLTVISSGAHSDWSNSTLIREKIQLKFSTLVRKIASKLWLNTKLFRCLKVPCSCVKVKMQLVSVFLKCKHCSDIILFFVMSLDVGKWYLMVCYESFSWWQIIYKILRIKETINKCFDCCLFFCQNLEILTILTKTIINHTTYFEKQYLFTVL